MRKLQVAVIGLGRLGSACADALIDETEMALAGWNPGVLPLFTKAFEILIPRGHNVFHRHPGVRLHHSASLLLEARFELVAFAARVMLDATRRIPLLPHGAHRYALN